MRFLIAIPFLSGADHSRMAIESVINNGYHDVLLIDNGASHDVKAVLNYYHSRENVHIISNPENIYVNPAWNQAMKFFICRKQYDGLILMNSDLILQDKWHVSLSRFYNNEDNANKIPVPIITDNPQAYDQTDQAFTVIHGGISGVFIVLPRKAVECVCPVPEDIKVWFGDNWIYDVARGCGFETGVLNGLVSHHWWGGSRTIAKTNNVLQIIEQDKKAWHEKICFQVHEKISKHNTGR